jgi:hypothetical protein
MSDSVRTKPSLTEVSAWCRRALGSPAERVLFEAGFASHVFGLQLEDGRQVVTRVRTHAPRLLGAAAVQRHLWEVGFPCPQPLAGPAEFAGNWVSAETLVAGGAALTDEPQAPELYAAALARLIRAAPRVDALPTLLPPPAWAHWDHAEPGLWPRPDGIDVDLNLEPDPRWLTEAATRVRARLASLNEPPVAGHADWWSENLRWVGRRLHVVYDWDSATAQPEAILAGEAAYMFAKTTFELDGCAPGANVQATERFLVAYESARDQSWTTDQREVAWAAGLWIALFDARLSRLEDRGEGFAKLVQSEADERLRRAGA